MINQTKKPKSFFNPWDRWDDDNPEKLADNPQPKTIGFASQVKNLVNPSNMFDYFFGQKNFETSNRFSPQRKEITPRRETLVFTRQTREIEMNLARESQQILQKLQKEVAILEKQEKALSSEISKIKVEQLPRKTSIYYLHFLEWLLLVVRQLRRKIEDGRTWLATFSQRKKKRFGYWQMYKKHGTTFGLSHERAIATQTG